MTKKNKSAIVRSSAAEYLTFIAASGQGGVEAVYSDESVWITQKMMGLLYDVDVRTVSYHLKNVFVDNELEESSVIQYFRITATVRLVQFIITRCYLVTVVTPDLDSAYRIFGVLNSRGLNLSATDILKAKVIGDLSAELRDSYTKKWEDKEDDLGRDTFADLFGHIRMVYRKAKPKSTLLKEFKDHVALVAQPLKFMDELLLPMAEAFGELLDSDYASQKHAEKVNEHLYWLNRLEFKDWIPPALAFFVRYRHQPDVVLDFFQALERLGYSMLVRKSGVNDRIERFSALTGFIEKSKEFTQELTVETSPLQLTPREQYDTYEALTGPLYDTHSPRNLAILLLRLDRLMSDGSASYRHDVVSVEHVLPQQPAANSQWLKWVPDPQVHQHWVHRLGNLALLSRSKNSAAKNYDFNKKKSAYFTKGGVCAFALTTQVLQYHEWTDVEMKTCQESMLKFFETHWQLQGRQSKSDIAAAHFRALTQSGDMALFELESEKHGLVATASESGVAFTVLRDSQAKLIWSGQPHVYMQKRQNLCDQGVLIPSKDGSCLVFAMDFAFKSPSAAAAAVLGRADNGRISWRLQGTLITYAAWQENLPPQQSATGRAEA